MNAKTVADVLDVLAARFGTTVAHLWSVLIRQVYVEAAQAVVWNVAFGLIAWACWRGFQRELGKDSEYECPPKLVAYGLVGGLALISIIAEAPWSRNAVTYLFNPEYGALKLVGEMFGGIK